MCVELTSMSYNTLLLSLVPVTIAITVVILSAVAVAIVNCYA